MRTSRDLAGYTTAAIGVAAGAALLIAYALLEMLRPKMIAFEPLTSSEEGLVNYVGVGLLLALLFCVLAVYRIIRFSVRAQRLSLFHLLVIAGGVLTPLFIFGDIALLGDIGNQYEDRLAQPEWSVLYIVMAFQLLAIAGLVYAVLFTLHNANQARPVARDSSVYLLAQFVGFLCGIVGLAFTVLNFFFPRPLWMVQAQIIPTLAVMLAPYALMVGFWLIVKLREGGEWFDEKQRQDVGASAFATLVIVTGGTALLYLLSLGNLQGMVSALWFPFYAFLSLLIFSAANLYRSRESLR